MTLSDREMQIIKLVGLSNSEIGKRLNIATQTVESHFVNIFTKTHTSRRTELLIKMLKSGEIKLDELEE